MLTPSLTLAELLPFIGKAELTMPDLEQLHGRQLPDGGRLLFPKVAPAAWASLAVGTEIAFRLTGAAAVLTGRVIANRLGHRLLPVLLVGNARSSEPLPVRRKQLREVRLLEKA